MEKKYFVMRYDEYREFVKDDAYNWLAAGHKPGALTVEDLYSEYSDSIDFMTEEEAIEANHDADEFHGKFSLEELCEAMNEAMQVWAEEAEA